MRVQVSKRDDIATERAGYAAQGTQQLVAACCAVSPDSRAVLAPSATGLAGVKVSGHVRLCFGSNV
jgi:hypothetical protein